MMADAFHPDPVDDGKNPGGDPGPRVVPVYPVNERGRVYDPGVTEDERTWSVLAHLSLLGHLVMPFGAVAFPWVIWLLKRHESVYTGDHAREALNFHLTLMLYHLITIPLALITCGIGGLLVLVAYVLGVIGMVQAAIAANRGEFYRYPMTFRFVRE